MTADRMLATNVGHSLRVAIHVWDATRLARLQNLAHGAGHRIAPIDAADVVLTELPVHERVDGKPTIVLVAEPTSDDQLPLDATWQQIDAALRAVAAGLTVRVAAEERRGFEELRDSTIHDLLTPREIEVLNALGMGLGNKAIARELGISLHTVKFHIESLLRKLGARTRAEAVAKAFERRIRETIEL